MGKIIKISILIKIFFLTLPILLFLILFGDSLIFWEKKTTGTVLSCLNNKPIADANISLSGRRWGWGTTGLIWDKDFTFNTKSDINGKFELKYKWGPTSFNIIKEGYRNAKQYENPKENNTFKLLKGSGEGTLYCIPRSECSQTKVENGVTYFSTKENCKSY